MTTNQFGLKQFSFKKVAISFLCPECTGDRYQFIIHRSNWKRVRCPKCRSYIKKEDVMKRIVSELIEK